MQEILDAAEPAGAAPNGLDQAAGKPIYARFGLGEARGLREQTDRDLLVGRRIGCAEGWRVSAGHVGAGRAEQAFRIGAMDVRKLHWARERVRGHDLLRLHRRLTDLKAKAARQNNRSRLRPSQSRDELTAATIFALRFAPSCTFVRLRLAMGNRIGSMGLGPGQVKQPEHVRA
jgi:hypothetical protein